jgi:hypothetical protein
MQNRPLWFIWGSAPKAFGAGKRGSRPRTFVAPRHYSGFAFLEKLVSARRRKSEPGWRLHPRRVRYPILRTVLLIFAPLVCFGQEPTPTPSPGEAEAEQVVVSATRFDIPLDLSPASASVIDSEDFEQKQIERVSDALREVPGLSVVQTGTAGQLT